PFLTSIMNLRNKSPKKSDKMEDMETDATPDPPVLPPAGIKRPKMDDVEPGEVDLFPDVDDDEEESTPERSPSPRVRSQRQCAEVAKKKIKTELRPGETRKEEAEKKIQSGESPTKEDRECSCERSDCPVTKTCCLGIAETCMGSRPDVGKLFVHLSKGEHVCKICYEQIWTNGRPKFDHFMDWKGGWMNESRCAPSLKAFIQDQLLPFWLQCNNCAKFRALPMDASTPTPSQIVAFVCENCEEPANSTVIEASERSWITTVAAAPLLHNSPALHYLAGDSYYYDELGMSPMNSECDEKKAMEECSSRVFMAPFNLPHETSIAFSVRPDCMEHDETEAFPEFSVEPAPYLALRNLIFALWTKNPFIYLTPRECSSHLVCRGLGRVWMLEEMKRVFDFLNIKGIINYGILELPEKPVTSIGKSTPEVIVVGGGISGLAAARQLRGFGVDVKVIEARAKIGGRMQDDWSLGVAVGCGAQLVTGILNNPIALMCEQVGVGYRALTEGCPLLDATTGGRVDAKVDRVVDEQFNAILDAHGHWRSSVQDAEDGSLYEHLTTIHEKLLKLGAVKWTEAEERVFQWNIGNTEFSCGAKLDQVSALHWDQNESLVQFAGAHALLTEGSSEMIKRLGEGTDIRLNCPVEKITWGADKKCTVACKGGKKFTADSVIIAVPLAVLHKGTIEFVPPLPKSKCAAIKGLGAGLIEKIAVRFPRRFWSSLVKEDGSLDYFGHVPADGKKRGLFNMFYDFSSRGNGKNEQYVLMSYVCGDSVDIVNELSDVEVVQMFVDTLQEMFGDESIPEPTGHVVTHWGRDPYIGMSYSYVRVGATGDNYDGIAGTIANKLHFAGECTNRFFPQTMTGAYLSGVREAGKLLENWRSKE
ncbi:hypothetical protein PFISCL1PPCAC_23999, partial [Pristionchus fissidentatus]